MLECQMDFYECLKCGRTADYSHVQQHNRIECVDCGHILAFAEGEEPDHAEA